MATILDKEVLKEALKELLQEEPATFRALLKEVLIEVKNANEEEFEQLLKNNFDRFQETFKALA